MKVEDNIPPIITADQSITYERGITKTEQAFYTDINAATSDNSAISSDFSKIDLTKQEIMKSYSKQRIKVETKHCHLKLMC